MKRRWNWRIWVGFLLVVAGMATYVPVFAQFPITRDFPWVNLLMFAAGLVLLGAGLTRAYRRRDEYRGRVFGPILALLSVATVAFFVWGIFIVARDLPTAAGAPHVGQKAPDFTLPDQDGKPVALADLLAPAQGTAAAGVRTGGAVLIFYRGHW
jgi:hypothetical protein